MAVRESKLIPVTIPSPLPGARATTAPSTPVVETPSDPAAWQPKTRGVGVERLLPMSVAQAMAIDIRYDGWVVGENGRLYQPDTDPMSVPGLKPTSGRPIREKLVWVNGIMTPTQLHIEDMQAMADTGHEVVGIRNATAGMIREKAVLDFVPLARAWREVAHMKAP